MTTNPKGKEIVHAWHIIDLSGQTLGRVSTRIASLLMGKGKAIYSPHLDMGDNVVAVNSDQIKVTGKKLEDKKYYRHSGYPGGLREISLGELMKKDSRKVIEKAVKGMLPKNKLQTPRLRRLRVFKDENHRYKAQLGTPPTPTPEAARKGFAPTSTPEVARRDSTPTSTPEVARRDSSGVSVIK